ncbi:MAG: hypothetical protein Ct9H300mP13_5590 [Gammaproteobacteria bacterium]|nr:MAG: hypothetical protein Ct9H300mP13_5590 [Gammaproteobacteria bacterium]
MASRAMTMPPTQVAHEVVPTLSEEFGQFVKNKTHCVPKKSHRAEDDSLHR